METCKNSKLKKKLKNKGITLDDRKKKQFDYYNYYQVVNAYKNIFCIKIEDIDNIKTNIQNAKELDRYKKVFECNATDDNLFREIVLKICRKYGIQNKYSETTDELVQKIKGIKYYNHIYSSNVIYSDFVRMYKFEHELRNVLLKYTLIIEESLKTVFTSYLNDIEAKDSFLTDINQYETGSNKIGEAIKSIKLILDKQTNKHSNPIKRKNQQNISFPYWILINELTLGETIKLITNLSSEHNQKILEKAINYFTKKELKKANHRDNTEYYNNRLNVMREILNLIGIFRNNLAHNQPIYCFNVREYYSTKSENINYSFPDKKQKEQHILNAKYMSYLASLFGTDKYNSRTQNVDINLSWIIYVIYKIIQTLDKNNNFYDEMVFIYQKYNIILRPQMVSINNMELYNSMLMKIQHYIDLDFGITEISSKISDGKPYKKSMTELNKKINNMKLEMVKIIKDNDKFSDCNKYKQFPFENKYTKYTGIDKKYFDKLKS